MLNDFFKQHKPLLEEAVSAIETRGFYSAYPEVPSGKIYGETAKQDGKDAFEGYVGSTFILNQCDHFIHSWWRTIAIRH